MSTVRSQPRRLISIPAAFVAAIAGMALVTSAYAQPNNRPQRPNGGGGPGQRQNDGGGANGGPDGGGQNGQPGGGGQRGPGGPGGPGGGGGPGGRALADTLGLRLRPVPADRDNPTAKPETGLIVQELADGSPAASAGLKQDDRITKLGDQLIINTGQFATLLALQDPGASVTLEVVRGEAAPTKVTLPLDAATIDAMRQGIQPPQRGQGGGPGGGGPGGDGMGPPPDGGQGAPPQQGNN